MRVLIVDDEKSPREALKHLLQEHCPDVEVTGMAENVNMAYELALATTPDLVLLDISMPPSDGFAFLKKFTKLPFEVIFTTAYQQYAIQAIKHAAIDYLLKPVDTEELTAAIEKVRRKLSVQTGTRAFRKIPLPAEKSVVLVAPEDIIRVEAHERKLSVYLRSKQILEVNRNLSEMETLLSGNGFFRAHRAHIINLNEVKEYLPDRHGGFVIMLDGKAVPIAARRKEEFQAMLSR